MAIRVATTLAGEIPTIHTTMALDIIIPITTTYMAIHIIGALLIIATTPTTVMDHTSTTVGTTAHTVTTEWPITAITEAPIIAGRITKNLTALPTIEVMQCVLENTVQ